MRILKLIVLSLVLTSFVGCACRTKKVGPEDNVPFAAENGDLADIHFAFDKYDISAEANSILAKNAEWLKAHADRRVQIEGHTDERGTQEYNMALGAKRARAAYDVLRSLGIEESRMSTISYGEELPLDPRHNEEAWAKNRRDHFAVK
ncbi:MAG: peptidoglycan-associated lipoprotein Pal [Deltaproteobacteria bacterium]|nr:peptidoglycan-associated lipoprotein Pal [Deltaproteobacteria bacterium]